MNILEAMSGAMGLEVRPTFSESAVPVETKAPEDSRSLLVQGANVWTGLTNFEQYGIPLPTNYERFSAVYANSVWVYRCASIVALSAAGVQTYVVDNRAEGAFKTFDVPAFEQPNSFMSFFDLKEAVYVSLGLLGNAYLEIVGDELYWIRPDKMRIVPDKDKFIKEFVLQINRKYERFKPEEIVHFKEFNPLDVYYGLSPLAAARLSVDSDYDGRRLYRKFFQNAAIPAAVLETDQHSIHDSLLDRVAATIQNLYGGLEQAFKPMILPAGLKWREIQVRPHDAAIIDFNQVSREEILAAFGVPPILVGLETQSYATAREQKLTFWQNTVLPRTAKFETTMDLQYLSRRFGRDFGLRTRHDTSGVGALQEAWTDLGKFISELKRAGVITANEARIIINVFVTAVDFKPFEGGDVLYEPGNLVPVGEVESVHELSGPPPRRKAADLLRLLENYSNRLEVGRRENIRRMLLRVQAKLSSTSVSIDEDGIAASSGETPVFLTEEYEEHRLKRSVKYREQQAKNRVVFTSRQMGVR